MIYFPFNFAVEVIEYLNFKFCWKLRENFESKKSKKILQKFLNNKLENIINRIFFWIRADRSYIQIYIYFFTFWPFDSKLYV